MIKNNLVSIIVPVYNASSTLSRCIDSLLAQTYKNIEIILINDGSTDNSLSICNGYKCKYSNIKLISQNNSGPSTARNVGLENASGEYIFFIDSDDFIDKNVIEFLIKNSSDKDLVGIKHKIVDVSKSEVIFYDSSYSRNDFINQVISDSLLGVVWGYLFDKNKINDLRFDINTSYLEDTIFLFKYLINNSINNVIFFEDDDNYYNYVLTTNGITRNKRNLLKKVKHYIYSSFKINELTNYIYNLQINNKIIIFVEKEMRNLTTVAEFKEFVSEIKINKFFGKSIRYNIFSCLYRKNFIFLLRLYYFVRKFLKSFRNGMK